MAAGRFNGAQFAVVDPLFDGRIADLQLNGGIARTDKLFRGALFPQSLFAGSHASRNPTLNANPGQCGRWLASTGEAVEAFVLPDESYVTVS